MIVDRHDLGERLGTTLYIAGVMAIALSVLAFCAVKAEASSIRNDVQIVGGRPAACFKFPKTARRYCGCASALKVGLPNADGRWNLARNWFRFPRSAPGPGMAVVRRGHVSIIEGGSPGAWRIYDPNSGGGLTRRYTTAHLRGTVVNPRVREASAQ